MPSPSWRGVRAAVELLCSSGFLVADDRGDASVVLDGVRYVYTILFWVHVGEMEPTHWAPDGEPDEARHVDHTPASVASLRARIADVWTGLGAPREWAESEADEALAWELFLDVQEVGWLRA